MKKLTKQANLTKKQVANYLNMTLSEYIDLENNPQKLTLTTANHYLNYIAYQFIVLLNI